MALTIIFNKRILPLFAIMVISCNPTPKSVNRPRHSENVAVQQTETSKQLSKDTLKISPQYRNFTTKNIDYTILKSYRHNNTYYTQGLFFDDNGNLLESTGYEGKSKILRYKKLQNQFIVKDSANNDSIEFGEGICGYKNKIVQVLYRNMYIRILDKSRLTLIKTIPFDSEGWGICNSGNTLFESDGTKRIKIIDISGSVTKVVQYLDVVDYSGVQLYINELEFIDGYIFANIWQTAFIYIIDPATGFVVGKLDFTNIQEKEKKDFPGADILNGIAWNKKNKTLLVTGKYWNHFYEVKIRGNLKSTP